MVKTIKGGCGCGAVRYALAIDRVPSTYACHCRDCQTWTGSAFNQVALLDEALLTISGPVVVCEVVGPSGNVSRQRVCGTCHTRLYSTNSARPGRMAVRAGTLDESDQLEVMAHIWTKRKQSWVVIPVGVPFWEEGAPPEEFMQALQETGRPGSSS